MATATPPVPLCKLGLRRAWQHASTIRARSVSVLRVHVSVDPMTSVFARQPLHGGHLFTKDPHVCIRDSDVGLFVCCPVGVLASNFPGSRSDGQDKIYMALSGGVPLMCCGGSSMSSIGSGVESCSGVVRRKRLDGCASWGPVSSDKVGDGDCSRPARRFFARRVAVLRPASCSGPAVVVL